MWRQVGSITKNKASACDEIPAELFQTLKVDAFKVLHSVCNKVGKLSMGHRTGKGQFSFQSQRRAIPKNVQTSTQLHALHMLAKKCSKFSMLGFSSTWTENFQMLKLDLEKRNQKSNCQHPLEHRKSKRVPKKTSLFWLYWLYWQSPKPLILWIKPTVENS